MARGASAHRSFGGVAVIVVIFIALLELARESLLEVTHAKAFATDRRAAGVPAELNACG